MNVNTLTITELESLLDQYQEYIVKFTLAMKAKFNVTDNSILYTNHEGIVPKMGELNIGSEKVVYRYHGAGCSVDYNGVHLEFDIYPYDPTTELPNIKFSAWKFELFLVTYLKLQKGELSTATVDAYLQLLKKAGYVEEIHWGPEPYHCYYCIYL